MALSAPPLHFLVVPFPAQGHVNPLLFLSAQLALRGSIVTFVNPEGSHQGMIKSRVDTQGAGDGIRVVTIPHGLTSEMRAQMTQDSLLAILKRLQGQLGVLEEMIESSKSTASPISCIISDSFLQWTLDLGKKFGIPRVLFWTSSLSTLYMNSLVAAGKLEFGGSWVDTAELPNHPGLSFVPDELLSMFPIDNSPMRLEFMMLRFNCMEDNASILVNSFYELEGPLADAMPYDIPIRCVGPLLPHGVVGNDSVEANFNDSVEANFAGSLTKEETECLQWLDKQASCSVLYISFGSVASLKPTELTSLALGIEASEQPFLWVIRAGLQEKNEMLPEGFLERIQNRGHVSSWAPQLRVLSHPSVAGFLTHCGWNSTIDSIVMGVPMLCLPLMADQPMNCVLITKQWKAGLELERKGEGGTVEKEEVERMIRLLMVEEEGRELRKKVQELKNAARNAVRCGGRSETALTSFVKEDAICQKAAF